MLINDVIANSASCANHLEDMTNQPCRHVALVKNKINISLQIAVWGSWVGSFPESSTLEFWWIVRLKGTSIIMVA